MPYTPIIAPVVALVAWSMVMMIWMYLTRFPAMRRAGIEIKGRTNVVALGISTEGAKIPLGLWEGSTENATVATAFVVNCFGSRLMQDGPSTYLWVLAAITVRARDLATPSAVKAAVALDGADTYVAIGAGGLLRLSADKPPDPDLQVSALAGDEKGLTATVSNAGPGPAKATVLRFQLDGEDAGDIDVPALRSGESRWPHCIYSSITGSGS